MPDRNTRTASLMVLGAAACLGALGTISTLAYRTGLSAPMFVAARAVLGAAVLGSLVLTGRAARTSVRTVPRRQRAMLGAAIVTNATMNLALFMAFDAMTVALVMTLYYSYPVMVAMAMAISGRDPLTPSRIAALGVAMGGLLLVIGTQTGPDSTVTLGGILLGLLAAACQAAFLIVSRDGYSSVPPEQATTYILLGGAVLSTVTALSVSSWTDLVAWTGDPGAWLAILVAGTLCAALPKVWLLRGVRRFGGTRTSIIMLAEPVFGVVLAAIVLTQPLTPAEVVGGLAVLGVAATLHLNPGRTRDDRLSVTGLTADADLPGV